MHYLIDYPEVDRVPVFVISLVDQFERRARLVERGVPKEWTTHFFSGFDLRDEAKQPLADLADLERLEARVRRPVLASELGCAISHRLAASRLLEIGGPLALVLEDDFVPESSDWMERMQATARVLLPYAKSGAAFICHLGARRDQADAALSRRVVFRKGRPPKALPELFLHADPDRTLWRAHAYLISSGAAARDSNTGTPIRTLADDWWERRRLGLIEEIFFTRPVLISQDEDVPSTIGSIEQRDEYSFTSKSSPPAHRSVGLFSERNLAQRIQASLTFRCVMAFARIRALFPYSLNLEFCEQEGSEGGAV